FRSPAPNFKDTLILNLLLAGTILLECGVASWYGPGFHGNRTASGEVFNQHEISAAHKTLPFGTEVIVVDDNGNQLEVVINDRGPYTRGRIIDLSRAGAAELGFISQGTTNVCLYIER